MFEDFSKNSLQLIKSKLTRIIRNKVFPLFQINYMRSHYNGMYHFPTTLHIAHLYDRSIIIFQHNPRSRPHIRPTSEQS